MTRDLPTLRDISVAPRQCLTLRFERKYAQRIARRPSVASLAAVVLLAAGAGLAMVAVLAGVWR